FCPAHTASICLEFRSNRVLNCVGANATANQTVDCIVARNQTSISFGPGIMPARLDAFASQHLFIIG
ncbi:MAG TPA: hypothetical protein VN154_07325, partial [Rhizomicrobium sp.]|nr:hypothetical protein [Rhizomicrobium sp.]